MTTSPLPDDLPNTLSAVSGASATGAADVRRLFDVQHVASRREPAPSLEDRQQALETLRRLVRDNNTAFATVISKDFGNRSRHETELMEIVPALSALAHTKRHLAKWMKPEKRHTDMNFKPAKSWIRYEPLGVVGIISPWNYPLLLAVGPLIDVLAAGNRALVKPSEFTPAFSALFQELVTKHFSQEQVAVVTGGPDVAASVAALPLDHLMFTGSTAIGRKVAQAAAANLTPITLELGGKSPAIVCADYPIEKAAASIAIGKFLNSGQTCIAPDYALVPAASAQAFAEAVMAKARKSYPKLSGNADHTSVISDRHRTRLTDAVAAAKEAGAAVVTHSDPGPGQVAPTVVTGVSATSLLMREEIFGPVLPIVPYENLDTALAEIRAGERPLALYCFSNDKAMQDRVLDGATSGGVTLNGTILHVVQNDLPFGGIGPSGIGSYHGREGFRRFSHARSIHKVGGFSAFEKLGPPWGRVASFMIKMMKRG